MNLHLRWDVTRRLFLIAVPLALGLSLIFPTIASAHAILLRSDPAKDAVLSSVPQQVRMWFSEDLNPAFSTAVIVDQNNQRVDTGDAHVAAGDPREMDVTLRQNLGPAVYIVVWRTDSADDGHVLRGSFLFSVARADGSVPSLSPGANPGGNELGGGNITGLYTGQLDGPTLFNLVMITLVELGAVFWVGAQLWLTFVLQLSAEAHAEQKTTNERVQQRFERRLSVPVLLVLLLANIGVLVGQALNLTGGQWGASFAPSLIGGLATSGRFGTFWLMREIVIALTLLLGLYLLLAKRRPQFVNTVLPWINLACGLALFIAITMSSHAAAVSSDKVVFAIMIDWLHLLAAALWVGGMMYIAANYLPVLRRMPIVEQAQSFITVIPYFSPLAIVGVVIMSVTGPFNATFHLTAWQQFLTTAYGRALLVKILLIGGLMLTSAIHVGLLRPRLKKEYQKYAYALIRLQSEQTQSSEAVVKVQSSGSMINQGANQQNTQKQGSRNAQQVRLREKRLVKGTKRLSTILGWEPALGVGVLICVGLMNVFAGTLSPIGAAAQQQQTSNGSKPFITSLRTSDNKFTVKLNVNPNRFGTNVFTVSVVDNSTGAPTSDIGVSLYTTMLDMDMGTDSINLLPDGKGNFKATGDLTMAGDWEIRIQIRTPDNTLHEAKVKLLTPF